MAAQGKTALWTMRKELVEMPHPNNFSTREIRAIQSVGQQIEVARTSLRLSLRAAASRAVTPRGAMNEATWRRVEHGYLLVGGAKIWYKPRPATLTAMAEVVGLDGAQLAKELGLETPARKRPADEEAIKRILSGVEVWLRQVLAAT